MSEQQENRQRIIAGLLAHVDAGKTTLAEGLLYCGGVTRKIGRVDHGDAFLDTYALEKQRGITIFSKQARLIAGDKEITLMDTPGHVDFSAEMERTLSCLDYGILVINASDGVQGHVLTLWRLLTRYQVPTFLFINKMDLPGADKKQVLSTLQRRLDSACIAFGNNLSDPAFAESLAECDEDVLETYLETGIIDPVSVRRMIRERKVFPCYFGSALKMEGIEAFLEDFALWTESPAYGEAFGARVVKIFRDAQGTRLTQLKVTGGVLKAKQIVRDEKTGEEAKADQLRLYSGAGFQPVREAPAGTIASVTGLDFTYAGEGLGKESPAEKPMLSPVLTYQVLLPEGTDIHVMYQNLKQLEEEDPQLHIVWQKQSGEIHAQVMGDVQIEILKNMVEERFHTDISFGQGSIVYLETITAPTEGVGHFEPLRHYAEVHLLMEPAPRGTGITLETACSLDVLDANWQNLILTHLAEKEHRGVLTGASLTDMRITLLRGRAHIKHTEGGDFREATYRAVRQGVMSTQSILLEPVYNFTLEIPGESVGRAMNDLNRMHASFSQPEAENEMSVIRGTCPVSEMQGYQKEVAAYSRGLGHLYVDLKGYEVCHDTEKVIEAVAYDPEHDLENPAGSVFCSHGAGFPVRWFDVPQYMHLPYTWKEFMAERDGIKPSMPEPESVSAPVEKKKAERKPVSNGSLLSGLSADKELEAIFTKTYGPVLKNRRAFDSPSKTRTKETTAGEAATEYLLVDGYNIIFDWEELRDLAKVDLAAARLALMDLMSNYQGFKGCVLILVFDAYKVENFQGEVQKYHNIYLVYTREAETADQYIEKAVMALDKNRHVTVASSDGIEQLIIMGTGALRMSAAGLKEEVFTSSQQMRRDFLDRVSRFGSRVENALPEDAKALLRSDEKSSQVNRKSKKHNK